MSLAAGTRLGAYDIVSLLGEGGMGAVTAWVAPWPSTRLLPTAGS